MKLVLIISALLLSACSSHSVMPVLATAADIKVSRDDAPKGCEFISSVEGRSTKISDSQENVLNDLKMEAVKKGANYVKIEATGSLGTSIKGSAYFCK